MLLRTLHLILRLALFAGALTGGNWLFGVTTATYLAERHRLEAETHLDWGRLEEALGSLDRALELAPSDAKLHRERARVEGMAARFRPGYGGEAAIADYRRAIALNPLGADLRADLGWAYTELGRYAEADAAFGDALALDPHNVYFLVSLARLREREGRALEAVAAYERALAIKPEKDIRRRLNDLRGG